MERIVNAIRIKMERFREMNERIEMLKLRKAEKADVERLREKVETEVLPRDEFLEFSLKYENELIEQRQAVAAVGEKYVKLSNTSYTKDTKLAAEMKELEKKSV